MPSASITIQTSSPPPTLAPDGKTLSFDVQGGTGTGYDIGAGITKLEVKKTNAVAISVKLASSSISGATVTAILDTPMGGAETLTLDLDSSSNLTDDGGNTATGQSAVAVTNASTQTAVAIDGTTLLDYIAGRISATASVLGHTYTSASDPTELHVTVNGADNVAVGIFGGTTKVTVDAGSEATKTSTNPGHFELVGAATGLGGTSHTFKLNFGCLIAVDLMVYMTASSGTPTLTITPTYGKQVLVGETDSPYIARNSGAVALSAWHVCQMLNHGDFRFRTKCTTIRALILEDTLRYRVWVDGVAGSIQNAAGTGIRVVTLATGLDNSAYHDYRIEYLTFFGVSFFAFYFDDDGLEEVAYPVLSRCWAWYGNSETQGIRQSTPEVNFTYLIGEAKGIAPLCIGTSGRTVFGITNAADITGRIQMPSRIWNNFETNDFRTSVPVADSRAAYETMLRAQRAELHARPEGNGDDTWIYCQCLNDPDAGGGGGPPMTYDQSIIDAVNTVSADVTVPGHDRIKWINVLGVFPLDGSWDHNHWTEAQQPTLAQWYIPFMEDVSYTISGPSSGASGAASTTFTLTIASGGAFLGGLQTITLTASDGTITATAAGGSISGNGTIAATVTPAVGTTSFTFTYTPASAGSKTITYAGSNLGVDPSASSYTASGAGPTVPGAPTLTSDDVERAQSGTNLTPTAPVSNGGATIIDYQVERDRNGAGFVLIHTILAADLINGYLDTGTAIGDDVIYRVRCRNSVGYSPYSATQEVTSQGPLTGVVDSIELLFD